VAENPMAEHIVLLVTTTLLAVTYSLLQTSTPDSDFPVACFSAFCFCTALSATGLRLTAALHAELFVSYFARPFWRSRSRGQKRRARKTAQTDPEAGKKRKQTKTVLLQVFLALLVAVPLLCF
jgi:hypothetical protein